MVLDLNRFKPGNELPEGVLWVAEQIPGLVMYEDATDTLLRGYWPSYNVPYFKEVWPYPVQVGQPVLRFANSLTQRRNGPSVLNNQTMFMVTTFSTSRTKDSSMVLILRHC